MLFLHTFRLPSKWGPLERTPYLFPWGTNLTSLILTTALCRHIVLEKLSSKKQDLSPSHIQTWVFNSIKFNLITYIFKTVTVYYFMDLVYTPSFTKRNSHTPECLAYLFFPTTGIKNHLPPCVDFHGCRKLNSGPHSCGTKTWLSYLSLKLLPSQHNTPYLSF